jgi:hypothetical protein
MEKKLWTGVNDPNVKKKIVNRYSERKNSFWKFRKKISSYKVKEFKANENKSG